SVNGHSTESEDYGARRSAFQPTLVGWASTLLWSGPASVTIMATATDASATLYLNTAWMIAPQRAGGGGGGMPAAGATSRSGPPPRVVRGASAHHPCDDTRRAASYFRPSLRRAG